MTRAAIGIDVGGTAIKGAAIDLGNGQTLSKRYRVSTPAGGKPDDIAEEVAKMMGDIHDELTEWQAHNETAIVHPIIGVALPGVVSDGAVQTAANIDDAWIGTNAVELFSVVAGRACVVINDADAAGIAEVSLGAAKNVPGTVMVLTFGTGIGTACLSDGTLVPNFELGHLQLDGHLDAERWASAKAIAREGLTLSQWAQRAERYVQHLEELLHPSRFVLGGSISKDSAQFLPFSSVATPTVAARFKNNAGIIGAAILAARETAVTRGAPLASPNRHLGA